MSEPERIQGYSVVKLGGGAFTARYLAELEILLLKRERNKRTHLIIGGGTLSDEQLEDNKATWEEFHRKRLEALVRHGLIDEEIAGLRNREADLLNELETVRAKLSEAAHVRDTTPVASKETSEWEVFVRT